MAYTCNPIVLDKLKHLAGNYLENPESAYRLTLSDAPVSSLPGEKEQVLCDWCVSQRYDVVSDCLGEMDVHVEEVQLVSDGKLYHCDSCKTPLVYTFSSAGAKRNLTALLEPGNKEVQSLEHITPSIACRLYMALTSNNMVASEEYRVRLQFYELKLSSILHDIQLTSQNTRKKLRM